MTTPPFPLHVLPAWMREMVEAVAANAQVDPAMPAMIALGTASYTVARNVEVYNPAGLRDPLALWMLVVAEQGEGKSTSFHPLVQPIRTIERALAGEDDHDEPAPPPGVVAGKTVFERLLDDDLFSSTPVVVAAEGVPWVSDLSQVAQDLLAQHRASRPTGSAPRLLVESITPEMLVEVLGSHDFGVFQASSEGQLLTHIAAGGPQAIEALSHYSRMWEGASITVNRITRVAASPRRPVLTVVVAPQPAVLDDLRQGRLGRLIERQGFLSRFLFVRPDSSRGRRRPEAPAIPESIRLRHQEHLRAMMLVANVPHQEIKSVGPLDSPGWRQFFHEVEVRRADGGDLAVSATLAAWASRVRQSVGRIAGILHLADHAGRLGDQVWYRPLDHATIDRAIVIGRWLLDHGRQVLRPQEAVSGRAADDLVAYVRTRFGNQEFSARDVHRGRQAMPADQVRDALEGLVATGVLTWSPGRGGSRFYRLVTGDT